MATKELRTVAYTVRRLAVEIDAPYDEFRERYELAVPPLDAERLARLTEARAGWDAVLEAAAENAPHGFMIYWRLDCEPLMGLAGDQRRCMSYLMGNHTIAQRMYHHDPAMMLYAPLRTTIHEDADGRTWFGIDQPSSHFSSFGNPAITDVGRELDRKVAALLEHLGAPVPSDLSNI